LFAFPLLLPTGAAPMSHAMTHRVASWCAIGRTCTMWGGSFSQPLFLLFCWQPGVLHLRIYALDLMCALCTASCSLVELAGSNAVVSSGLGERWTGHEKPARILIPSRSDTCGLLLKHRKCNLGRLTPAYVCMCREHWWAKQANLQCQGTSLR
jgi:hypothetical protein